MNIRISLILLIFSIQTLLVELRPSKSLDQPAGDLEWEALLLIHDSNRPKFGKITPKSIFTVRPHSTVMPPCAEGYQSDAMGRCVTKIDQNAHYEFLVQKLNSQNSFDPSDYEDLDEEIDTPTTGPFQINIPIEKSMESDVSNDDTGNFTVVVAPVNDLSMNLTSINNTLNIISLTKELLKNLTTEVKVKPLERNETVLSLLDDFLQNDQPAPTIERETQTVDENIKVPSTSNEDKSVENTSQNKSDNFNLNDPETIIILFHALPNSTSSNNRTAVNQDEVTSTTESVSTTTEINSTTTTDFDDAKTTTEDIPTSEDDSYESDVSVSTESISSTSETSTFEEFDLIPNTFPHNGDFKNQFFHLRWNDSSDNAKTKKITSPEETTVVDRQPEKEIVKINFPIPTLSSSLIPPAILENQQLVKTPEYNHRSRDRNIFWYNPIYSSQSPETTSERINSKYYSTNSHLNPYRRIFRKTLQDNDRLFNTRRWSNR